MKKILWIISCLISLQSLKAQTFKVLEVDKAVNSKGKKIAVGDILTLEDTVMVKKGTFKFNRENYWAFELPLGKYGIGLEYQKYILNHSKHHEICTKLDSLGFFSCDFPYPVWDSGKYDSIAKTIVFTTDYIQFDQRTLYVNQSSITLTWKHPKENFYQGKYYVLLMDFGEEYLDFFVTLEPRLTLDLTKYTDPDRRYIIDIITEECRRSGQIAVIWKK